MAITAPRPPAPPSWAAQTVREPDRIVHERLSTLRPVALVDYIDGVVPTEVSVSVADVAREDSWVRRPPTVQVEGGSYSVPGAWQLYLALREVLAALGESEPARSR
jgi:hypothetical protein